MLVDQLGKLLQCLDLLLVLLLEIEANLLQVESLLRLGTVPLIELVVCFAFLL